MRQIAAAFAVLLAAAPLAAQSRVDVIVDVEGVRQNEIDPVRGPETGTIVRYEPAFDSGGGIGVGLNWRMSNRFSIETKVAGLASRMVVRVVGSDFVANADLGYAQLYPIMVVAQWHPLEGTGIRPYLGAGASYTILRNIEKGTAGGDVVFENPVGLVLNAGLRVPVSNKWSFLGDARYIAIDTRGSILFAGPGATASAIDVRPLVVGFGVAYHW